MHYVQTNFAKCSLCDAADDAERCCVQNEFGLVMLTKMAHKQWEEDEFGTTLQKYLFWVISQSFRFLKLLFFQAFPRSTKNGQKSLIFHKTSHPTSPNFYEL